MEDILNKIESVVEYINTYKHGDIKLAIVVVVVFVACIAWWVSVK